MRVTVSLLIFAAVSLCAASEAQDALPSVGEKLVQLPAAFHNDTAKCIAIIDQLSSRYAKISSWQYVYQKNAPGDIAYDYLLWRESGSNYYYDVRDVGRATKTDYHAVGSYDGERGYQYYPGDDLIIVAKDLPDTTMVQAADSPLMPFSFIKFDGSVLRLNNLQAGAKELSSLLPRTAYMGEQRFQGKTYDCLRFVNSYDQQFKQQVTYDVLFDSSNNFFPMIWKEYDNEGVLIKQFQVTSLQNIVAAQTRAVFSYPKEATLWQSKWGGVLRGGDGEVIKYLGEARTVSFKEVTIDLTDPEADCTMDMALASTIFDRDSKKSITVPK